MTQHDEVAAKARLLAEAARAFLDGAVYSGYSETTRLAAALQAAIDDAERALAKVTTDTETRR